MKKQQNQFNLHELISVNEDLTRAVFNKKKLESKLGVSINLHRDFSNFFTIAADKNYTDDQIKEELINSSDEMALIFCSSIYNSNCRKNPLYRELFPTMLNKLTNNIEYTYYTLFKVCYWYFMQPIYYPSIRHPLDVQSHLDLIFPYLKNVYNKCGEQLYQKCRRGYNLMLEYFVLFQEFMTSEMFSYFLVSLNKKFNSTAAYESRSCRENIVTYLNSSHIRRDLNKDEINAMNLLFKLL